MSTFTIPTTQKAFVIHELDKTGTDFSVIKYKDIPVPKISSTEILIKNRYTGINFVEKYFRTGFYPTQLPFILGREASGIIVDKGDDVKDFEIGDYVAYASPNTFAEYTKFTPTTKIFKLSKDITEEKLQIYASLFIQGFTALTFVSEAYNVQKGDYILVHAAAGGVGLLLTQLINLRGGHVIGIASTKEKLELVKSNGAEYLINSSNEDIVSKVKEFTNGKGVQAVYDGNGKDTYQNSIDSLAKGGSFVSFGNTTGIIAPINLTSLSPKNIKISRPSSFNYISEKNEWEFYSNILRNLIENEELKIDISKIYPFEDYVQATKDFENRKTTGKLLLKF